MATSALDIELSKYWSQLTPIQKKSLLGVIKSFTENPVRISVEQYNHELSEAEDEYQQGQHISSDEMLELIRKW
jgi:hypothetical protein